MNGTGSRAAREIERLVEKLIGLQKDDGSWRFCFDNGTIIDAYAIILFRCLGRDDEPLIRKLRDRILARQDRDGCWRWYRDETDGSLSSTVEAYYALLCSGYSRPEDEAMRRAKAYIWSRGGAGKATSILTQSILAATGQRSWPLALSTIPLEVMLIPDSLPLNLYSFSGYARVHLVPMLVMAAKDFKATAEPLPDLSELFHPRHDQEEEGRLPDSHAATRSAIREGMARLIGSPGAIREAAADKAERFMLDRIESDGTLYSYGTSTVLLAFALLALGYDRDHPVIQRACEGLKKMRCESFTTLQNSPPDIWDTALLTFALQQSGVRPEHPAITKAADYLLRAQHTRKGDWSRRNPNAAPGGWGFSETNTINPDVDDTTAALRAIRPFSGRSDAYRDSWNRGLTWTLSMQNADGGWPAFEKNTDNKILTWLAIEGAKSAAIDPSEADLTGRTLEFLGNHARLRGDHRMMRRGASWLIRHQKEDGSWYGRWGICYIYGTWAALTGLAAAGLSLDHDAMRRGTEWLLRIQNEDGGWGESCSSDKQGHYVPLGASTPSQTAWALDALLAASPAQSAAIEKGVHRLCELLHEDDWASVYPTGAGLPGNFYMHYHSYRYIWPLLALSRYRERIGG
ncbi:squalene--hopene cyclase [Paenibacillus soyae]|uniref:Squalene--hopene cyclase n=1 Tax=Paenibacillus soyae TaxID=2969249 RepID=A0A9X2MTX2_9BACL|nr:squalene--hopene cyclase [Paenibacillus soyae]MCR2806410.1 squalene--hopene cyclase [Paenibacillus soyae]